MKATFCGFLFRKAVIRHVSFGGRVACKGWLAKPLRPVSCAKSTNAGRKDRTNQPERDFAQSSEFAAGGLVNEAENNPTTSPNNLNDGRRPLANLAKNGNMNKTKNSSTAVLQDVASPIVLFGAVLGFGFVTTDVLWASSFHLLTYTDQAVHEWVTNDIPQETRDIVFEKVVSYAPIILPFTMWNFLGSGVPREQILEENRFGNKDCCENDWSPGSSLGDGEHLAVQDDEHKIRVPIHGPQNSLFYQFGTGTTITMLLLKRIFHRPRPGTHIVTSSFPSGHTTLAVLFAGMLIFIWSPFFEDWCSERGSAVEDRKAGVTGTLTRAQLVQFMQTHRWSIWFVCWAVTAIGRIGADAHWVSDSIAGGLLGISCTSLMAAHCLRQMQN